MDTENQTENQTEQLTKRVVAVDSQILNNMETCYYKWYLYNLMNYRPKNKSKAFDKGWLVHEIIRAYYTAKIDKQSWAESVKIAMEIGHMKVQEVNLPLEDITQAIETCNQYMNFYRGELWKPLAVEEKFSYKFYEDAELIILYEGIVDLRVETDVDPNHPVDHKTTSRNDQIHPLNNQFIGYCRAHNASRMTINRLGFQKSLKAEEKFTRHLKSYSKEVQEEWAQDVIHTVKMGILHHDMGIFPRNFTSCDGKYGPCMFSDPCGTELKAREWKLKVEFDQPDEGWDPLARD